jgi:hypothetical protein
MTPEQHLYLAVCRQAVVDLVGGTREDPRQADLIRKDALSFFTDRDGPHAAMRAEVCEAINRDPDDVREAIILALETGNLPDLGRVRGDNLEKTRALWREKKKQEAMVEAFREQQAAKRKPPAPKPAPVIIRRKRPTPAPIVAQAPPKGPIKPTRRAAKPWLCPPRDPADDWLYGIAPAPN